jgi:hypothetical protein
MVQSNTPQAETPSSQDGVSPAAKMDPALKAKWVEALRSGKFKQGTSYLQRENKFCCLGVLLKIQGFDIMAEMPTLDDRMTVTLPSGLNGGISFEICTDLGNRNDGSFNHQTHNFPEIADYIEANL